MENLLKSKRFLPLLLTQFLGALNDNLFKNALLILVTLKFADNAPVLSNVIAGLFIIPFFLFSSTAGEISDKFPRHKVAHILKITELCLMLSVGIVYLTHNITLLVILLALMGAQSAFFGPVKYALLPQQLKPNELVAGNAYVEATTYIAILLGLIIGTLLPTPASIILLITLSAIGVYTAFQIPAVPAVRKDAIIKKNILKSIYNTISLIHSNKTIFYCILGATWFWSIGAFIAVQIYPLANNILGAEKGVITLFLLLFSLGVATGSLTCSKIMKDIIHTTYIPISTFAMGVCMYLLYHFTNHYPTPSTPNGIIAYLSQPNAIKIILTLFALAFFGGLYIVPLNALMQSHAPKSFTATVIGGNNILNALGMTLISVFAVVLLSLGFSIPQLFLSISIINLVILCYVCKLLPDALVRSILQAIFKTLFRVNIEGLNNFKKANKKLLIIANHTSLLDALLIASFLPEKITFAINTEWAKKWYIKMFGFLVELYALDPTNPMAIRSLIKEVNNNKRIMIFPEGRISVTGGLMKVYDGSGVVAHRTGAKILPIRINGAQFSKLSYLNDKIKTRLFPQIDMTILPQTSFDVPENLFGKERRRYISMQVYHIMTDMLYTTSKTDEHLFNSLLESAKTYGYSHKIAEDIARIPLTYNKLLLKSYILGSAYKSATKDENFIGLLLPNSLANLVSFFALQSIDKTPVMLNFSHGVKQMSSCLKTIDLKTVITSRQFIEKARLSHLIDAITECNATVIYLEDFAKTIAIKDKLIGLTHFLTKKRPQNTSDKTATILFTSGSEGMPKAVLLSHKNLQANRYQITSVIALNPADVFFNSLPMFHSFGLSVGTILPVLTGIRTFFYPSPLHYRIVPELIYDTNATIVCGTDTFFSGYGRMGHPYDFYNIKYAVVGGEKLKDTTADLWIKKFGIRILEGYGSTETSPVLTINTPMYNKQGTVGKLLPHITYKLEAVEGVTEGGKLLVKGDNVMQGYMKSDKPCQLQPCPNNWYDTGDIVKLDSEGFVSIMGRAKRFAKVAGEMVSLTAVEQAIDNLYPKSTQGIITEPDNKKGEQLILITNREEATLAEIRSYFKSQGFSEIWIPKRLIYVAKPPLLGTGKFDYQTAKQMLQSGEIN